MLDFEVAISANLILCAHKRKKKVKTILHISNATMGKSRPAV